MQRGNFAPQQPARQHNRETAMDFVIPYQRTQKSLDFAPTTTKFTYEEERTVTRVIRRKAADGTEQRSTEETTEDREKKVYLKVYSMKEAEDCEHFFEAFETLQHELRTQWKEIARAKANDARTLFNAMEAMLEGTASTEWKDVLNEDSTRTGRNWEDFKHFVSQYVTKKVVGQDDAYARQRQYMMERKMPYGMEVRNWWLRMQTMNRYLPYFLSSMVELKKWFPTADFTNWWKDGGLSAQELKHIVLTRVPTHWTNELAKADIGRTVRDNQTTDALIDYYAMLQRVEHNRRGPTRNIGGRRFDNTRGRVRSNYNNYNERRYDNNYGRVSPGRDNQRYYHHSGGRMITQQQQHYGGRAQYSGGRGGSTAFRGSGRFGVQQSGYSFGRGGGYNNRAFGRGGRFGRGGNYGQYGQRPAQAAQGTAFYQEQEQAQEQAHEQEEGAGQPTAATEGGNEEADYNEQFAEQDTTEEELIEQWNENLFMEAPQDLEYYEDDEGFYGEPYF